ncbi:MAG: hypothetical protein ACQESR_26360 [Planctomycetota bacterium]
MKNDLLRNCKACGKEISRHSAFCRNCGHPQVSVLAAWIVGGLVVMMLLFSVAFFFMFHLVRFFCR